MVNKKKRNRVKKKSILDTTESTLSAYSNTRTTTLQRGKTYRGCVVESFQYRFIVLVEERFRVLVHNVRFVPLYNQRDVPICCVLANGDEVFLTAIKNCNISKYDEEWVAEKCWVEQVPNNTDQTNNADELVCDGTVTSLESSRLYLNSAPNIVEACSACILLHGFPVDNVDLNEVFRIGDNLSYYIDSTIPMNNGKYFAKKAWFGSYCTKSFSEATSKLLKFCVSRKIRREVLISLSTSPQGNSMHNEKSFNEDSFNVCINYVKPLDCRSEKTKQKSASSEPELIQNALSKENAVLPHCNLCTVLCNDFHCVDSNPEPCKSFGATSIGTQTYSTGSIFGYSDLSEFEL